MSNRCDGTRDRTDCGAHVGSLCRYVPTLRAEDDLWRLKVVTNHFGLWWESLPVDERLGLSEHEPELFDPRWDAFLAAYVEYKSSEDGLASPAWTQGTCRFLGDCWVAIYDYPELRKWKEANTPESFRRHRIWIPDSELIVV